MHYTLNYTSDTSQSQLLEKQVTLSPASNQNTAEFQLSTELPGYHEYSFSSISDGNYQQALPLSQPIRIQQRVHANPQASFIETADKTFYCQSDEPDETTLPILLQGKAPFELEFTVKQDHAAGSTFSRKINSQDIALQNGSQVYKLDPGALKSVGRYNIELTFITDATGCRTQLTKGAGKTKRSIHVADQAKITSNNPEYVCIGDILSFALQGTPPFSIGYSWNNESKPELTLDDPILTFYASKPGTLSIQKVCNGMKCCQRVKNMQIAVKPLPSAIVNGGQDVIEDIREGTSI